MTSEKRDEQWRMKKIFKIYSSEWTRIKLTSLMRFIIGVPLILGLLLLFVIKDPTFELDIIIAVWGHLILPLGSIIFCIVSTYQFQSSNLWKTLINQPIFRLRIVISHMLFNISIVLLGTLVLFSVLFIEVYFSPINSEVKNLYLFGEIFNLFFQFALTIPTIIIQTFVVLISSNVVFSLLLGLGGFLKGAKVSTSYETFLQYIFVFDYVNFLGPGSYLNLSIYQSCGISMISSIVWFVVGYLIFRRRKF